MCTIRRAWWWNHYFRFYAFFSRQCKAWFLHEASDVKSSRWPVRKLNKKSAVICSFNYLLKLPTALFQVELTLSTQLWSNLLLKKAWFQWNQVVWHKEMKRERFKPPEPDDPLCCCGDIDQQREYCCCDCEELDDACERSEISQLRSLHAEEVWHYICSYKLFKV